MNTYLTPTDPDAFLDFPEPKEVPENYRQCNVCSGHGGWNLKVNSYNLPVGFLDTQDNRHRFVHFRCVCSHCSGYGYVHQSETCSGHEWVHVRNLGRCYNQFKCIHCGKISNVDSSD